MRVLYTTALLLLEGRNWEVFVSVYDTIIVYRYVMWYDVMPLRGIIATCLLHLNALLILYSFTVAIGDDDYY